MLVFNPADRITIENALMHEFFQDLHCDPEEPTTTHVSAFDFDFEKYELSTSETAELIHEEILLYHSAKAQNTYLKNRRKYPKGMLYLKYGKATDRRAETDAKDKIKKLLVEE